MLLESLMVMDETSQMNCPHWFLRPTLTSRSKMHIKYGPTTDTDIPESIQLVPRKYRQTWPAAEPLQWPKQTWYPSLHAKGVIHCPRKVIFKLPSTEEADILVGVAQRDVWDPKVDKSMVSSRMKPASLVRRKGEGRVKWSYWSWQGQVARVLWSC